MSKFSMMAKSGGGKGGGKGGGSRPNPNWPSFDRQPPVRGRSHRSKLQELAAVTELPVPCLCLVTDRRQCGDRALEDVVSQAIEGSVNLVQLRKKDLVSGLSGISASSSS